MALKIGIISQARMTSTRLPGKVLKKVKDKTLLEYHVERLKKAGDAELCIATTVNETDDSIVQFCQENHIKFYRGSEEDVLSRYYECALANKYDVVVRVTSDCPLVDGELIKKGLEAYQREPFVNKYVSNSIQRTFARGFDFEIFSFDLLEQAYKNATEYSDREHVTPFIKNKILDIKKIDILNKQDNSNLRITVDEPDDFNLVQELILNYSAATKGYEEIESILLNNKHLIALNQHIEQKKV
ncbi:acylneuraminate cytidylyltransferase [Bacteriovorax stolpii]|uniref:cytidylyltransferase domain-containing protein n=1 Tax=Bacteriovorax stolpii TaxID=960 RepID=UPI00115BD00E|nr:glycosyltransferase family protein [Bacteriovorax stolpii]QDK43251.1 acylneuraminate cytidylyltransferase [Bacteriovorax stolpii]